MFARANGQLGRMAEVRGQNYPEPEDPWDPAPGMPLKTFAFNDSGIAFCAGSLGDRSSLFCAYLGVELLGKISSSATTESSGDGLRSQKKYSPQGILGAAREQEVATTNKTGIQKNSDGN